MHPNPPRFAQSLTHADCDRLLGHPAYARLRPELENLIQTLSPTTFELERTAVLTWAYQSGGAIGFSELCHRILGEPDVTRRKKQIRANLRTMQRLRLISIINFPGSPDPSGASCNADVVGAHSLVSLTHLGMVWLDRAWSARHRLGGSFDVHRHLVDEEEESRGAEPHWCEDLMARADEGAQTRAKRISAALLAMNSVFSMGGALHSASSAVPGVREAEAG